MHQQRKQRYLALTTYAAFKRLASTDCRLGFGGLIPRDLYSLEVAPSFDLSFVA